MDSILSKVDLANPDAPRVVLTRQELETLWGSDARVFALVPRERLDEWGLGGTKVMEVLDRLLLRNR